MMPPALIYIGIKKKGRGFRLWLPLFLLWPIVAVLFLAAISISVVTDLPSLIKRKAYFRNTRLAVGCLQAGMAAKGLRVWADNGEANVKIRVV